MTVQLTLKRKKKLLTKLTNPNKEDIHNELDYLIERVVSFFKSHIGKENSIGSKELFEEIYLTNPDSLTIFEKSYLWNVLKIIMQRLRSSERCFIVSDKFNYYVLKTREESNAFRKRIDSVITALKETKVKADRWVNREAWRNIR